MKIDRRQFTTTCAALTGVAVSRESANSAVAATPMQKLPCFISTWPFGKPGNDVALETIQSGKSVLDAIEQGIRVVESDVSNTSVGIGGTPNAAGVVSLDACIMNGPGHQAGCVGGVENILHVISLARAVMENTKHVMLVGQGAQDFALKNGFQKTSLLTDGRRKAWEKWKAETSAAHGGPQNHDTITMVGIDKDGTVAAGCSTSGLGYKLPGRVGDSPILGSGLYVDNEVGGAGATGTGENVMRYCASFMIVEAMRHGVSPQDACVATIHRIAKTDPLAMSELHINFLAIDKRGNVGAAGTDEPFKFAVTNSESSEVFDAEWVR